MITDTFDSWSDFVEAARTRESQWEPTICSARRVSSGQWDGAETFEEAIDYAENGWPKGREKMAEGLRCASTISVYQSQQMDVAGAYPIIPIALAGDPCSMMDLGAQTIASRPIVRLRVDMAAPYTISGDAIINNGVAILSMVDAMEVAGYSVEISLTCSARGKGKPTDHVDYTWSTVFKRAGEPMDVDRCAFALVNPAVMRRMYLALMDSHRALRQAGFGAEYGWPCRAKPRDDDILLPPVDNYCDTVDAATARIAAVLEGHGITVSWQKED